MRPSGKLPELVDHVTADYFMETACSPRRGCQSHLCPSGKPLKVVGNLDRRTFIWASRGERRLLMCPSVKPLGVE